MSSLKETGNIRAVMIFDIIGKPPEHLTETLNEIIEKIDEEKGVVVKEKKINEPVLMRNPEKDSQKLKCEGKELDLKNEKGLVVQKDFYTSFAEIEIEVEEIFHLVGLMFKYMPAHIEIISPELIALTNNGWGDILNEITRRLHGYDEVARVLQVEKKILENKLREVLGESE